MTRLSPGCKVNLSLLVTGKLANGYHTLKSIFFPLKNPHDILEIRERPDGVFNLECDTPLPGKNILQKTWEIFCEASGACPGADISLKKRIPAGAGLGGGSSDAAALLMWLNEKNGRPLPEQELKRLASEIGADVPFFLLNRPALAAGMGEVLTPLENWPQFWLVFVWPDISISTAVIFRELDMAGLTNPRWTDKNSFSQGMSFMESVGQNDLEPYVLRLHAPLRELKDGLAALGADYAAMSGSGSCFFGLFFEGKKAEAAYSALAKTWRHVWLERFSQNDVGA